jgi:hypothetical protein
MTAFADMMRKQIVMPAHLMDDLEHQGRTGRSLFKDFSSVAQMTGTYTSHVRCRAAMPFLTMECGQGPMARVVFAVSPQIGEAVCAILHRDNEREG